MSSSRTSPIGNGMRDSHVRLKPDTTPVKTINAETAEIAETPFTYVGCAIRRTALVILIAVVAQVFSPAISAQTPVVVERVTFQQAIDRAIANNPSAAVAAAGILRAEGLLAQARSATLLQVTGNVTTTTLNKGVVFQDETVVPRSQVTGSLT